MDTTTRPTVLLAISAALVAAFTPAPARADVQPQDTPAATRQKIQQAIDTAGADGTVTLGNGTFEIDAELMVTNCVKLVGQGWTNTIVKQTANGQRVATLKDASTLQGVTATGGKLTSNWVHGAGVLVEDGTVSWCCITNNLATGRNVHGGGVSIMKGTVDHSIVAFNQAGTHTSVGGGIGIPSGYDTVLIDACLIYGNIVSVEDGGDAEGCGGGGFGNTTGNPNVTIRNTTITDNSSGKRGGGVRFSGNKVNLVNCIVSGNAAEADADVSGTPASGSEGNLLGVDPALLFVDTVGHDYHLDEESPAIRAGVAYAGIATDLDGTAFAEMPSVGCYEYIGEVAAVRPVFSPAPGTTFYPSIDVSLSCRMNGVTIRYTTDGTDPTEASTPYTAPIRIDDTTTFKAVSCKDGILPSRIVEATYTRVPAALPPEPGTVTETPGAMTATLSGEIVSVGNNGATACDIYLATGKWANKLGARERVVSGATTSFSCAISGLATATTYYYELTFVNNAQIPASTSVRGQFTTTSGVKPVPDDPAGTRKTIQDEIDAVAPTHGTVVLGEGLFEIDAQLMVTSGVRVVGQGWKKTTIKQTVAGSSARCATVSGGASLEGVTLTGGHTRAKGESGAGVLVEDGTVSWCCITNNQTGDPSWAGVTVNNVYGAGVHVKQGTVDHTIIACNTAYATGGGASHGGGLGVYTPTGPITVDTCLFYGNRAPNGDGGAIYANFLNNHFLLAVRNTTIATNSAAGFGGGVYVTQNGSNPDFALVNSILADNVSGGGGADPNLALPSGAVAGYAAQSFGNLFANGTMALGQDSKSVPGAGTSWFVKPEKGNFHLPSGSPAARVGKWYEGIAEDLDGSRRLKWPAAGCYEAQSCTILILR